MEVYLLKNNISLKAIYWSLFSEFKLKILFVSALITSFFYLIFSTISIVLLWKNFLLLIMFIITMSIFFILFWVIMVLFISLIFPFTLINYRWLHNIKDNEYHIYIDEFKIYYEYTWPIWSSNVIGNIRKSTQINEVIDLDMIEKIYFGDEVKLLKIDKDIIHWHYNKINTDDLVYIKLKMEGSYYPFDISNPLFKKLNKINSNYIAIDVHKEDWKIIRKIFNKN